MDKRAKCNKVPPDTNQSVELLQKLLKLELERLDVAMKIERERNIVFPETTVIIHDIQKVQMAIENKSKVREFYE